MTTVKKAVIPAAGIGTRMRPLTDYLPKPMLPLGRKPVLHHIIDELMEAGVEEIAVIAHPDHESVFSYFGRFDSVELIADSSTSGPGGAMLKAESFVGGEPFWSIFSDAPVKGERRGHYLRELAELWNEKKAAAAVALYRVPASEVSSRGVVLTEPDSGSGAKRLKDIAEKPSPGSLPESSAYWASACRYLQDADIFDMLKAIRRDTDGELQLTPAIRRLIQQGKPVFGLPLPGDLVRCDTGNFRGYFQAFSRFADPDPEQ